MQAQYLRFGQPKSSLIMYCHACAIYKDVSDLLGRLGIPPREQSILWDNANKTISCTKFKKLLSTLIKHSKRNIHTIVGSTT